MWANNERKLNIQCAILLRKRIFFKTKKGCYLYIIIYVIRFRLVTSHIVQTND
jgi:hypothetical protein